MAENKQIGEVGVVVNFVSSLLIVFRFRNTSDLAEAQHNPQARYTSYAFIYFITMFAECETI